MRCYVAHLYWCRLYRSWPLCQFYILNCLYLGGWKRVSLLWNWRDISMFSRWPPAGVLFLNIKVTVWCPVYLFEKNHPLLLVLWGVFVGKHFLLPNLSCDIFLSESWLIETSITIWRHVSVVRKCSMTAQNGSLSWPLRYLKENLIENELLQVYLDVLNVIINCIR